MKITALQMLASAERANKNAFNLAVAHLKFLVDSHTTGIATAQDPNLKQAFEGTLANAKRFLDSNPQWEHAEMELPKS